MYVFCLSELVRVEPGLSEAQIQDLPYMHKAYWSLLILCYNLGWVYQCSRIPDGCQFASVNFNKLRFADFQVGLRYDNDHRCSNGVVPCATCSVG